MPLNNIYVTKMGQLKILMENDWNDSGWFEVWKKMETTGWIRDKEERNRKIYTRRITKKQKQRWSQEHWQKFGVFDMVVNKWMGKTKDKSFGVATIHFIKLF